MARLLAAAGVEVQLYEARNRLGGRVLTLDATGTPGEDGFDLGPSWVWPQLQPAIGALIDELELATFAQSTDGDVVFERMSREPAQRYPGVRQEPRSLRLVGGSAALVRAIARDVPAARVHLGASVTGLALHDGGVRLAVTSVGGGEASVDAEFVVTAVPPRLLAATVGRSPRVLPEWPSETLTLWRATPTWMASQAKFFALYDQPFWLDAGYSGTAQSMVGPMLEMHDATTSSGGPALFGFLGVGPAERQRIGARGITEACVGQFARLFGPRAESPSATLYQDWATDSLTSTADDLTWTGHPSPAASWVRGPWSDRLVLAGSEVSPAEAGYLAGAVEAATLAAADVCRRLGVPREAT